LLASWNDDLECFQTICKVGTGFSEELLAKLKIELDEIVINKPANSLKLKDNMPQIKCDVYFEPKYVWEIKAADLSLSPMHTTALGTIEENKGIALRFPRMIRVREDKQPMECTNN
jgi:DNA ligase-1